MKFPIPHWMLMANQYHEPRKRTVDRRGFNKTLFPRSTFLNGMIIGFVLGIGFGIIICAQTLGR